MPIVRLKLQHGRIATLVSGNEVLTTYTDYSGTSRSSACTREDFIAYCQAALAEALGNKESISDAA